MSIIEKPASELKYPSKEKATAFKPETGIPFSSAVVGVTYPVENYSISSTQPAGCLSIEFVLSGQGEILKNGEWVSARAGDVFFFKAAEPHTYRSKSPSPWHKLWIAYSADYIDSYLEAYGVETGVYRVSGIKESFESLVEFTSQNPPSPYTYFEISESVHKIIHRVALSLQNGCVDYAERIRRLLDSMIYKKADLSEVAAGLHMSKSNIVRLYKKRFEMTPHQYLLGKKIETAKLLLKNTTMSIKEISEKLCILDEHYFSTLFLKQTGIRPKDYRKNGE